MELLKIFQTAFQYKASDIYISSGVKPGIRLHGDLVQIEQHPVLSKQMAETYILETMTEVQKAAFARSLDIDYALDVPGIGRFRVNVFMQHRGIGAVFRLIPEDVVSLDDLNMPNQLKRITDFKQGIVLITGPTGSGKSTTLAAIVEELNRKYQYNILTIEDPIEFIYKNKKSLVQQREVGTHTASFATALKAALRESTDVILIGETGHLVLSTLHTSGAAKSVDRVIDIFPTEQQNQIRAQLAQGLRAVVWQQLLKTTDGKGRVAALEILFANNAVENLIRKGKTYQIQSVLETGMRDGMQTMEKSIKDLALQGYITQELADSHISALKTSLSESE